MGSRTWRGPRYRAAAVAANDKDDKMARGLQATTNVMVLAAVLSLAPLLASAAATDTVAQAAGAGPGSTSAQAPAAAPGAGATSATANPAVAVQQIFETGMRALDAGRYDVAIQEGQRFNAEIARLMGEGNVNQAYGYTLMATGHSYRGDSAEAVKYGVIAYGGFLKALGPTDINTLAAGVLLAGDLAKTGAAGRGAILLDELKKNGVESSPAAADYFVSRAVVSRFQGRAAEAEGAAREAIKRTSPSSAPSGESDAIASRTFVLAQVLAMQPTKRADAERTLAEARGLARRTYGPDHPRTREMERYQLPAATGR